MPIISLDHLEPHPDNANRMTPAMLAKLVSHIRDTCEYPPLIVRPVPSHGGTQGETQSNRYQILDGHHRALALRELGHEESKCDVWHVDDERAAILLLTLNRLHGEDDPQRRGSLIEKLSQSIDIKTLAKLLPEDASRIQKLIEACHPPPPLTAPPDVQQMPQPVTFFLIEAQRARLFEMRTAICRDRSAALVKLLELDCDETPMHTSLPTIGYMQRQNLATSKPNTPSVTPPPPRHSREEKRTERSQLDLYKTS